jgi:hypothetical protein
VLAVLLSINDSSIDSNSTCSSPPLLDYYGRQFLVIFLLALILFISPHTYCTVPREINDGNTGEHTYYHTYSTSSNEERPITEILSRLSADYSFLFVLGKRQQSVVQKIQKIQLESAGRSCKRKQNRQPTYVLVFFSMELLRYGCTLYLMRNGTVDTTSAKAERPLLHLK